MKLSEEELLSGAMPSAVPPEVRQWTLENSTAEVVQKAIDEVQQHGSVELGETLRRRKARRP